MTDFKPGDRVHLCVMGDGAPGTRGEPVVIDGLTVVYEVASEPYQGAGGEFAVIECVTFPSGFGSHVPVVQLVPATE
jgi:hypothetical protein